MDQHSLLQRVYPLADAVRFSLFLCQDRKSKANYVRGHGDFDVSLSSEMEFYFRCKVIGSAISKAGSYIVFTVQGDLWALLAYDASLEELTFSLLDASHGLKGMEATLYGRGLKEIFDQTAKATVGLWVRGVYDEAWRRLDEVAVVDQAVENAADDHRATDRPVWG